MATKKHKKALYEEISDVIFVPKKKTLIRRILTILIIILFFGGGATAALYNQGYFNNFSILPIQSDISPEINNDNRFQTVRTFSEKPCGLQEDRGDEKYTEWFEIRGEVWKIILSSERLYESELSNTRVWYTTSSEPILEGGTYIEIGDGSPNYDTGIKYEEQEVRGSGVYRLRILCWNTDYSIEVQDSELEK